MNKTKVNEAAMISAIKASECGKRVSEICRELGVHRSTFYLWKKKYLRIRESEQNLLNKQEAENLRLKQQRSALESNTSIIAKLLLS
ncbi:transposase [Parapedobacter defluvii]|uniref:transposase n=1 Tax=Parapedobacter defluvii TaxID=2045106 RepID=UPI00333FE388